MRDRHELHYHTLVYFPGRRILRTDGSEPITPEADVGRRVGSRDRIDLRVSLVWHPRDRHLTSGLVPPV
jgi:hypothetical protein